MAWMARDKQDKWAPSTNYHNDVRKCAITC